MAMLSPKLFSTCNLISAVAPAIAFALWPMGAAAQSSASGVAGVTATSPQSGQSPDHGVPGEAPTNAPAPVDAKSTSQRDPAVFQRLDAMREPLWTTRYPSLIDTVTGDAGGWRSALADHGLSFEARTASTFSANLLDTGAPRSPQVYNGQRPTVIGHTVSLDLGIDLSKAGLGDTRLQVNGGYYVTTFTANGHDLLFRELSLYHGFFDRTVEVKVGWNQNYYEYAGLFAGGNPVLATGLGSLIPIQAGLSADPTSTPSINVAINGKRGSYAKFGVQRSVSPLGIEAEARTNGIGLDFHQRNAKALYIGEVGLKRDSAPGQRALWLRTGYLYNTSPYQRFDGLGTKENQAFFALADYQITQPDDVLFFRGINVGASFTWSPDSVNLYTKSAEARASMTGPFASRPTDAVNLTVTWNKFSDAFARSYTGQGKPEDYQLGTSLSYSIQFGPGIHVSPGVQYLVHPTPFPGYKNALLATLGLFIFM